MATLLTAASSELGRELAAHLQHRAGINAPPLRLTDRQPAGGETTHCELDHTEATDRLLAGVKTLVHLEPALVDDDAAAATDPDGWLDACTRITYNLLLAAQSAGVAHVLLLSRLDVLSNLEAGLHPSVIQPDWRPRPSVALGSLGPHLAEFTARKYTSRCYGFSRSF